MLRDLLVFTLRNAMTEHFTRGILTIFFRIDHTDLKGYSTSFGNRLILQLPQHRFRINSADFLIFRRISVTRQFLVSLTSIVEKNILW